MSSENKHTDEIEKFKRFVIQQTNEEIIEEGQIPAVINILCYDPNETKPVLALIPVPEDLMKAGFTKNALTNVVIPKILQKLEEEGVGPLCISLITEGWMWEVEKDKKLSAQEIEEIKKTKEKREVVRITFETENFSEVRIFDKMGTKKNAKGEYVEGVYLKEREDQKKERQASQFSNLFKKTRYA